MEATLPKPTAKRLGQLTAAPWTTVSQADDAADFVRQLRTDALKLAELDEEEQKVYDAVVEKFAIRDAALRDAASVEAALKPHFVAFVSDETERLNSELPESKHRKNLEGKFWKVQLKDKAATVTVTSTDEAVAWLETTEPTAVKTVKTVISAQLTQNLALFNKLKAMSADALSKVGIKLQDKVPNGASSLSIEDPAVVCVK
ncbi:MAG: hypothetical protein JSS66_05725 [Armatimonadetes bacterium]|nr:hypothetical protein [Armatimonadota bacterium]